MTKTKRELEEERRKRRKAENKKIQKYLDDNNLRTKAENLNDWDRGHLLDMLNGI